ncbi:MAG: DUF2339 domain-containing protein [Armatimonadota bacterium]|nr:MAG: DUF2339 domain-containing protein [Armatimonadota bacterium]
MPQPPTPPPPPPPAAPSRPTVPRPDLESLLGANWLSKLGVIAIAIATAFFLKYAFDSGWIGPTARIAIGLVASFALLGLGQFLLTKPRYRAYAQVLMSGGIIIFFLSVYAAYALYHLMGFSMAFALLTLAAVAASAVAAANNTEGVALLCIAGAFATPVLIRQDAAASSDLVRLYAYLAGLNVWSVILARYRPWRSLTALSFGATWLLFFGAGKLHGPNYLTVEAFAVAFLFFACYSGIGTMRAEREPAPEMQRVGVALILAACVAFAVASALILADEQALGLPALVCAGVLVAALLAGLAAALPSLGVEDSAVRQAFRYLSAAALALLIGVSVLQAPPVTRAQAPSAFLFGVFVYLIFLGVSLRMRRAGEPEAPAIVMLAADVAVHIAVAFRCLAPLRVWGAEAAPLWLPIAGWVTLGALWIAARQEHEKRKFPVAVMLCALALPLMALVRALEITAPWPAAAGLALFFGEFLLVSGTWVALRRFTAVPALRGDLLAAFVNAAVFFGLIAVATKLRAFEGLVLLCGGALAFAAYHAFIGGMILRRGQEGPLLRFVYLGLALTFATIAIPLQLRAGYITLAWAVESAILVWTGLNVGDTRVRWYGIALLAVTAGKALFLDAPIGPDPFRLLLNSRMLSGASAAAAAYVSAWLLWRARADITGDERPVPALLALLANTLTLIFISLDLWDHFGRALPVAAARSAQQLALTFFWSVYAVALIRIGVAIRDRRVRWGGIILLSIAATKSLFFDLAGHPAPFRLLLNDRLLSGAAVVAAAYVSTWLLQRERENLTPDERVLPTALAFIASLFTLIFVSLDLWDYFGRAEAFAERRSAQQLALSIFWSVYALAVMSVGIWRRVRPVRLFAMALLYVSIFKVFAFDLGFLEQPYRIVSFFGLGVILLVVSLLYTRFEERLK